MTARAATTLRLGDRRYDIRHRALVMGVLNRTTDSFYDRGAHFTLDAFLRRAEELVGGGADLLDIGARSAGVGTRDVGEAEETDLVLSSVEAVRARFDVPISVDTWRASVAAAALGTGATLANDVSGLSDAGYADAVARAGGSIVVTHMRLAPQVPDPQPRYDDLVGDVCHALARLAGRAVDAGIPFDGVVVDPGLDLGKTWRQSLRLLAATAQFCALGHPVLVAPSNKIFLGRALGLERHERQNATVVACTAAILSGARLVRVHETRHVREAADLCAAISESVG
jgi:dihydropteroate synthase